MNVNSIRNVYKYYAHKIYSANTLVVCFQLHVFSLQAQRYITQLKAQVNSLEAEVEDQRMQKQKALVDNEQLRDELEKLQKAKFEGDKNRGLYLEAEKKASTTEIRYAKLKEKHNELINTHAELLRKNADTAKQLTVTQQSQEEVARVKEELAFQMEQAKRESEMKVSLSWDGTFWLKVEIFKQGTSVWNSFPHDLQVGSDLNSQLDALQAEKETLRKLVNEKECELISTKGLIQEKELLLSQETEKRAKKVQEFQEKLVEKKTHEQHLQQKLLDDQFRILQGTIKEAESIIQDAVSKLDDPLHIRCTSSPDYLVSRTQAALESVNALEKGHKHYLTNMADATGLVAALAQFAHLMADAIVNGSATSHLAPTDHADKLTESCRDCGHHSLDYLNKLKDKQSLREADPADLRTTLQRLFQLGQELRPKSLDIREEELGDLVDKEMATTSAAVEDAVRRIEEMMNQARVESSGVKLEGAATPQEFYAKNSCWTEGLISASKAVGWGATQLVESADKVVLHTGKYEELIVCSHEIAASTAQLVAASKVKAEKHSKNLGKLQECSRTVNEKAANVVASTKSGQEQVEEKDTMDFSGLSLIKLKKEEMETQVKVLELEKTLENERLRLGELRRQHYALAGLYTENMDGKKPTIARKPASLQRPAMAQKPGQSKPDSELAQDGVYQAHVVNF
uniref:I/LWEQ domain-containing protein n=1 Tax=Laticauda laticaudata TaxID=8630 RepID=A0A8C5RJ99_LATLA